MVPFANIPADLRTPLFAVEFTGARNRTGQPNSRTLIIGLKTALGSAPADVPIISSGPNDARAKGGKGSLLARMTEAYRRVDPYGEVWYLPVAEPNAGSAAAGVLAFAGPASASGMLNLYIAGQRVPVGIVAGDTAATVASAVVTAINAATDLPLTAVIDGGDTTKVNLTAKHKGLVGNDIDLRLNYGGVAAGEATPAGLTCTITAMTGGAGAPDLATALANLGDELFDFVIHPFADTPSLTMLKAFMNEQTGRWAYARKIYGHSFGAYRGTYSGQTTFGSAQNDKHSSFIGVYDSPSPPWEWAAQIAAAKAVRYRASPGQPVQFVPLPGLLAPPLESRLDVYKRNALLHHGISTFTVQADGTVILESLITTYQTDNLGAPDDSFLWADDMYKLMYVFRALEAVVYSKYANVGLAKDGTRILPGAGIVTPSIVRADLIAHYYELQDRGLVQDADAFAKNLVVEINAANQNRLDVLYAGTLMGALRGFAVLAQFES